MRFLFLVCLLCSLLFVVASRKAKRKIFEEAAAGTVGMNAEEKVIVDRIRDTLPSELHTKISDMKILR